MEDGGGGIFGVFGTMIWLAFVILTVIGLWKIFEKAGKPGWAAIIPIYNIIVLLEIVGKPVWWIVLFLIPLVNLIISIIVTHRLSLSFGKGVGYTVGMLLFPLIFYPILGFSSDPYLGPGGEGEPQTADELV